MTASLIGIWIFTGFLYQGKPWSPPNPDLRLRFEFAASGINTLTYWREGERGFCERQARYHNDDSWLTQDVTWVNPQNASNCANDPDMQMGRHSRSPIQFNKDELHLYVPLGDDELVYIWKRDSSLISN